MSIVELSRCSIFCLCVLVSRDFCLNCVSIDRQMTVEILEPFDRTFSGTSGCPASSNNEVADLAAFSNSSVHLPYGNMLRASEEPIEIPPGDSQQCSGALQHLIRASYTTSLAKLVNDMHAVPKGASGCPYRLVVSLP